MNPQLMVLDRHLRRVLALTRSGNFADASHALGLVDTSWLEQQPYPNVDPDVDYLRLRYATLSAEIADHDGLTLVADKALSKFKKHILSELREENSSTSPARPELWRLSRQKLLFAWQVAVNRYRYGGNRIEVREILEQARRRAESLDPISDGLLTRLYYAEAKLHLRYSAYTAATTMYRECLVKASARFSNPQAESISAGSSSGEELAELRKIEKDAARYTVAKILTFGLGRAFFEQGRLEEARSVVVAGELLLEATHDIIYRVHANLLLGAIERDAASATDELTLRSARARLDDCLVFFASKRSHMRLRAEYELGLLELRVGNFARAEELIMFAIKEAARKNRTRWVVNGKIALSRIARKRKEYQRAIDLAESAFAVAIEHDLPRAKAEALSAQASALYEQAIANANDQRLLLKAESVLYDLLSTCDRRDVKARVMPQLLLTRVRRARYDIPGAHQAYAEYQMIASDVQIRRAVEFAEVVRRELYAYPGSA